MAFFGASLSLVACPFVAGRGGHVLAGLWDSGFVICDTGYGLRIAFADSGTHGYCDWTDGRGKEKRGIVRFDFRMLIISVLFFLRRSRGAVCTLTGGEILYGGIVRILF